MRGAEFVVKHSRVVLFILFITTIPFAFIYAGQQYQSSISVFFDSDDPDIEYYKTFLKQFGSEELLSIVFQTADVFQPETLNIVRKITDSVATVRGVRSVYSLTSTEMLKGDMETIGFEKLIPEGPITDAVSSQAKKKSELFKAAIQNMVSENGKTSAVLVELRPIESTSGKETVISDIILAAETAAGTQFKLHYAGTPSVDVEINRLTLSDNLRFTPIALLVILLITLLVFKNIWLSLLCQINIILVIIWSIGLMVLTGETINCVNVVIPPVLLAIATADGVHILTQFQRRLGQGYPFLRAVSDTVRLIWFPCLFTSLTTAIGYFSFMATTVRPVRIVGIFSGIGLLIAFLLSFLFLPAALSAFRKLIPTGNERQGINIGLDADKIARWVIRNYRIILVLFGVISCIAAVGILKIRYETDFASYLREENRVKKDLRFVETELRGTVPVDVVITAISPDDDFTHPHSFRLLDVIEGRIASFMKGRYTHLAGPSDHIKMVHAAFNLGDKAFYRIPETRNEIADYQEFSDGHQLSKFLSVDRMAARISMTSFFGSTDEYRSFARFLETEIKPILQGRYDYKYTGISALYTKMDGNLRQSQLKSFSVAFVLIFLMMIFVCRGLWPAVICMVPNFFPVIVTLGLMGWFSVPLDVSTIMIASVTIGIAVDDTIHFITWMRRNTEAGLGPEEAIVRSFADTGKPILLTTLILSSAYFVLISGSVKPVIAFGALTGVAMLLALIGDLFILPALLVLLKPFGKSKKNDDTIV